MGLLPLLVGILVALATRFFVLKNLVYRSVHLRRYQIIGIVVAAALLGVLVVLSDSASLLVFVVGNAAVFAFMQRSRRNRPS